MEREKPSKKKDSKKGSGKQTTRKGGGIGPRITLGEKTLHRKRHEGRKRGGEIRGNNKTARKQRI